MKKITFVMLTITTMLFFGLGLFSRPMTADTTDNSGNERDVYLNIMTCNKSQYQMMKGIVGDKHNVEFMFINEEDSLNFEITQDAVNNISKMDLFMYSGNDFEPWSGELIDKLKKNNLGVINLSKGIRGIAMQNQKAVADNPYYWTGVDEYKIALYNAKTAVQERDPKNRSYYEDNYKELVETIDKSVKEFETKKESLKDYTFISVDNNLDYFYRSVGINPIKLENNTVDDIIRINKLDPKSVIIVKDKLVETEISGHTLVELDRYDGNISFEELIIRNYNSLFEVIPEVVVE